MGLGSLRRLDLQQTGVTAEGVRKLQRALPKCEITSDFLRGAEGKATKDGKP
jgi:hypothetical protein